MNSRALASIDMAQRLKSGRFFPAGSFSVADLHLHDIGHGMIHNSSVETARLTIRAFQPADAAILVAMFSDPDVSRLVGDGKPLSSADAALWVSNSNANLERDGYGTGAVIERSSGQLIGWAGFARPQDGLEQLIYGLSAGCWGRGFGAEIVQA